MKLNRHERTYLNDLQLLRSLAKPPSTWGALFLRPKRWLLALAVAAVGVVFLALGFPIIGFFFFGAVYGMFLMNLAVARIGTLRFAMTMKVIDWEKVEAISREDNEARKA